jgi:hypothetical protein
LCYIICPSYHSWLGRFNYTWQRVQVMKPLIMQLFHPPGTSFLLAPDILLSTLSLFLP